MTREQHLASGALRGWCLPPPAVWWKRLPGVRHARAARGARFLAEHHPFWSTIPYVDTGYDEWVIEAIRRGWC